MKMERGAIVFVTLAIVFIGLLCLLYAKDLNYKYNLPQANDNLAPAAANNTLDRRYVTMNNRPQGITLFLAGDVMTGRGIDQILPEAVDPRIYEDYVKDARVYVQLAEKQNGSISEPVTYSYIWGDALEVWDELQPAARIINLETSITTHDIPWPQKGIHYRMHPANVEVLTAAGINFCSLGNNHTLDWSRPGLIETIKTLRHAGIAMAGAGESIAEASKPAILRTQHNRIIILAYGAVTSGIPYAWAATEKQSGINLLPDLSGKTIKSIAAKVSEVKQSGDIVVFSVHWGDNWGYDIHPNQRQFAHQLIDEAGVDLIFGHSSHHPMGMEVYQGKLILYGAGDFINDYEGIHGHEEYRGDLTLMYFPTLDAATGKLVSLRMVPMQLRRLQLRYASARDAAWLANVLHRESKKFGAGVELQRTYLQLVF